MNREGSNREPLDSLAAMMGFTIIPLKLGKTCVYWIRNAKGRLLNDGYSLDRDEARAFLSRIINQTEK